MQPHLRLHRRCTTGDARFLWEQVVDFLLMVLAVLDSHTLVIARRKASYAQEGETLISRGIAKKSAAYWVWHTLGDAARLPRPFDDTSLIPSDYELAA